MYWPAVQKLLAVSRQNAVTKMILPQSSIVTKYFIIKKYVNLVFTYGAHTRLRIIICTKVVNIYLNYHMPEFSCRCLMAQAHILHVTFPNNYCVEPACDVCLNYCLLRGACTHSTAGHGLLMTSTLIISYRRKLLAEFWTHFLKTPNLQGLMANCTPKRVSLGV